MPAPRQIRCEDCCSIHNGPFFVMHTGCVGLIDRRTAILPLDVARRMWMPSAMEEKDRRERIRRLLDQAFCVNEFRILPAEIRNMITPYLLKEYSVCTISNAWLERRRLRVTVSTGWVRYGRNMSRSMGDGTFAIWPTRCEGTGGRVSSYASQRCLT